MSALETKAGESREHTKIRERAFIAAPASVDTRVIRGILEDHGISAFAADELDLPGLSWGEIIREAIDQADVVIAVLGDSSRNGHVLFELGFAQAMKKRTLVIIDPKSTQAPPAVSSGIPYLRTDPTNLEAIKFGLAQFLASPRHGANSPEHAGVETQAIGDASDELLRRLRTLQSDANSQLIEIVSDAMMASGVSVVSHWTGDTVVHADMSVWSDDLEPWVSNPLLVAVKSTIGDNVAADDLFGRLESALERVNESWALVIYRTAIEESICRINRGPVLAISAETFLESLRTISFRQLIRNLRNARVHGR